MANPIVSSLPQYVDENKIGLVSKSVLSAKSAKLFNLQTGVKGVAAITNLDTDVNFGDGSDCGWTPDGTSTLSQRKIETGAIKINVPFCDKKLLKTYAQYQVKVAAGAKTLPFEEDFVGGVIDDVKQKLETAIWKGDKESEDANLNKFDGLLKIIDAEPTVVDAALASGITVYEAVKKMNKAIPAQARKEDTVILMGSDMFVQFISEMVDANLYHYSADNVDGEYKLPAFGVKVIGVDGLNGTNRIIAGRLSNIYYGTDLEGDEEKFEFWYSKDNREFRLAVEFNAGVQIAEPDMIVKGELK